MIKWAWIILPSFKSFESAECFKSLRVSSTEGGARFCLKRNGAHLVAACGLVGGFRAGIWFALHPAKAKQKHVFISF
ncbi:hypothetical protein WN944_005547 [Citrus x changshan-huyou]|uniref:Uncharacterized protein n=1 Tax=Citrus x changshan-huyou TaxID=2935761 RepID=A0AAP0M6G2_9ROSI